MEEREVGRVLDYYAKIGVVAIEVLDEIKVGDVLHFKGATTDFKQVVESMQIEHKPVQIAKKGDKVGIKVNERVRPHDKVYKVIE